MLWSDVALVVDLVMLELDCDDFYVEEPLSGYCYHLDVLSGVDYDSLRRDDGKIL